MRKVTINNTKIEIRPMTRKEIKALKAEGFPLTVMGPDYRAMASDLDLAERTVDRVFETVGIPAQQLDSLADLPPAETHKVWKAILAETYGSEEEEKN